MSVDLWQTLSRLALIGVIGGLAGACSSDTARLSGNILSNPFSTASKSNEPSMTASVPRPATAVHARPLAAPAMPARPSASAPLYNTPAATPSRTAALPARAAAPTGPGGWTAQGGTPIVVGGGDNLNAIANRYGVPPAALLSANGLTSPAQVTPGRRITIPVYNAAGITAAAPAKPVRDAKPDANPRVRPGQAAKAEVRPQAKVAAAKLPDPKPIKTAAKPEPKTSFPEPARSNATGFRETLVAAPKPLQAARFEPPAPAKEQKIAVAPPKAPEPARPAEVNQTGSVAPTASVQPVGLGFRWPARGRVISGFGGNGNEGINIALPEGTPVKAAEDGVVAYAGSEVKGYGKLVLIRHESAHVSAYAHNSELIVKPGEKVRRGQVIAKSGQSGNVTSPQLHFEIRKGSTPIDPMPHLTSG